MIVDVHTHLPRYRERAKDRAENEAREKEYRLRVGRHRPLGPIGPVGPMTDEGRTSWEDHYEAMKAVDKAVIFSFDNDQLAEYVKMHPDKMIGFVTVNPDDPNCIEEMRRGVNELGLKGLKVLPIVQGYHPHSYKATLVFKEAERLGIPALVHQATSAYPENLLELAQPLLLEKIAHQFPDLKIVYAHVGHPWWRDVIMAIRRNKNMYADIAANIYHPWDFYNSLEFAYEWGQLDKILFGTDFPVTTPKATLDALRNINTMLEGTRLIRIPEDSIEEMIQRDSLKLLGIE